MNWYLKVLKQYVDFNGRARRKEYWMFVLIHIIIIGVLSFVTFLGSDILSSRGSDFDYMIFILIGIYILATILPTIAVTVRRLHDINKSGWWYLINFLPYVGGFILLIFNCMDSIDGPNKWGKNPKNIGNDNNIDQIGRE